MTYMNNTKTTDLFGASVPVSAYRADPMTTAEIDAHPDADRIWATIEALRVDLEADKEQFTREREDEVQDARDEGRAEGRQDLVTFADCLEIDWEVYEGQLVIDCRVIEDTDEDVKARNIFEAKFADLSRAINEEYEF